MSDTLDNRLAKIRSLVHSTAQETQSVSPTRSRLQKNRLRAVVAEHCVSVDELNHVFQDINSTSALGYFDDHEADLIRQAASGLSEARRALRRLAQCQWLQKTNNS